MSEFYVIQCRPDDRPVEYWRGDKPWVTDINLALRVGPFNVAAPIAAVLATVLERGGPISPLQVLK